MTGVRPAAVAVEFRLFGRFVVLVDGLEVPAPAFGGRKVRQLLRIMLTRKHEHVSIDTLTGMLWPARTPRDPAANLAVLVTRARHAVGLRDLIVSHDSGYRIGLAENRYRLDTDEFVTLVTASRTVDGHDALTTCDAALELWSGEPLSEDRYDDWATGYRDMLTQYRIEALERGIDAALAERDTGQAVEWATTALAAAPLRENSVVLAMRSFAAHGDPRRALTLYDRFRRDLAEELGVDPSPATVTEFEGLLHSGAPRTQASPSPMTRTPTTRTPTMPPLRFVGRGAELDRLRSATASPGSVITVAGRSGTGKSRLLAELRAHDDAAIVRCFAAQRDDIWSMAAALIREILSGDPGLVDEVTGPLRGALTALVPDLVPAVDVHADAESMRALVIEVLARLIAESHMTVVVIDDLQWSDESSLSAVAAAIRRSPRPSWVLAYRTDEVYPETSRHAGLTALDPDVRITLGGLDGPAVRDLIADPAVSETLLEHTDHSPIAIAEALRRLVGAGMVDFDRQGRWHATVADHAALREVARSSQQDNLGRRLDAITGPAADVIDLLAILRHETPARELARVLDAEPAEVLDALTRLAHADLVRLGEQGWATAHDMISDVGEQRLDPARRARLHALAAAATDESADAASAARHWHLAGEGRRAAQAYVIASRSALDAFAHDEAISLAGSGLAIGGSGPAVTVAALHEVRALARARVGDLTGARADFGAALNSALPGPRQAVVLAELAMVASGSDDMVRAADLCEMAIVRAGADPGARARALEVGSVLDMNLDRADRAAERAEEAIRNYTELGDAAGVARVLDARAMATFLDGEIERGGELLARAADLFTDSGDLLRVITPRSTHGHALVFAARPGEGHAETDIAVDLARTLGHQEGITYALWHRSEASAALGHVDDALADAREALRIARQIGHRGWTATANRALGIAHQTRGDLAAAHAAFTASLQASAHLDLFRSWALSRLAMIDIANGELDRAEECVAEALTTGPGLGQHEARLARYLLAEARRDDDAERRATELEAAATRSGALAVLAVLRPDRSSVSRSTP